MPNNDIILLSYKLNERKVKSKIPLTESEIFEIFSFEQILKNYALSDDQLQSGLVDNGDDGGIDGFFVFLNEELLDEDFDPKDITKNPHLEIYLIQTKVATSFSEKAITTLKDTIQDLFDLNKDILTIKKFYNEEVIKITEILRKSFQGVATRRHTIEIKYFYASKGDSNDVHPKVLKKKEDLIELTKKQYFVGASVEFVFLGASDLLKLSRKEKNYSLQLKFIENYISTDKDNYVVLAGLRDYYNFVTDEDNKLRQYLFDANVRDFQGEKVEVNKDIQETLKSEKKEIDFWWLNNGITILASNANVVGLVVQKTLVSLIRQGFRV